MTPYPKPEMCEICSVELHPNVAKYSDKVFGRFLCIKCQEEERTKKYGNALRDKGQEN